MKNIFTFIVTMALIIVNTVAFGAEATEELKQFAAQKREELIKDTESVAQYLKDENIEISITHKGKTETFILNKRMIKALIDKYENQLMMKNEIKITMGEIILLKGVLESCKK